jgi:hypothetical protein
MNRLSRRQFRKAHLAVEARAEDRVIYAWHLTTSRRHDGPLLPKLLEQIEGPIGDVLGDGAYASRSNAEYVEGRGGVSYLRPRENWRPRAGSPSAWQRLLRRYHGRRGGFGRCYRYRVNVEGRFSSMKRRQGAHLRARSIASQQRELGWRCVVQNLELCARSYVRAGVELIL